MITFKKLLERAIKENITVHTATKEQAKKFVNEISKRVCKQSDCVKTTMESHYDIFGADTCYFFGTTCVSTVNYPCFMVGSQWDARYEGCKIIEFSEIDFKDESLCLHLSNC